MNGTAGEWPIHFMIVILLITCATICTCDDFKYIVEWGETHLDFLREFSEYHFGIPCARWPRDLLNRVDPAVFTRCLDEWEVIQAAL